MIKLTVFVAVSFIAIASLPADEPSTRWELTETLSYDDFRDGKLLTFHGHCDEKFLRPNINDFLLERLSPEKTWIPMIFGRDCELDWRADTEMTDVYLFLKCPGATDRIWHDEEVMQLFAQTWIESNASYRLTWSRRPAQRQSAKLHHVEFQLKGEVEADKERPRFAQRAYLCEVLYEADGVQFLGRTVRPPLFLDHEMPAIGFTKDGQPVVPPDPGYQGVQRVLNQIKPVEHTEQKPPQAMTTHNLGFSINENTVDVRVSDIGTSARLPQEPGAPSFVMFSDSIYRIELLTKNIEVLREDRDFWKQRSKQIREEWAKEPRR